MTIAIIIFLLVTNAVFIVREVRNRKAMRRIVAKAERVMDLYR